MIELLFTELQRGREAGVSELGTLCWSLNVNVLRTETVAEQWHSVYELIDRARELPTFSLRTVHHLAYKLRYATPTRSAHTRA